jgi:hypothetical protein
VAKRQDALIIQRAIAFVLTALLFCFASVRSYRNRSKTGE